MTLVARMCTAVALTVASAPALALEFSVERLEEQASACRTGMSHDGGALNEDATLAACREAVDLYVTANKMGLCYDAARHDWRTCQFTDE